MKKFITLLLVLTNALVSSFFITNVYAEDATQESTANTVQTPKADANGVYSVDLTHNDVEYNVKLNGFVGFLDIDLPIATKNTSGGYVLKNEKKQIPVLRMSNKNAMDIKIKKGGTDVNTATAYPAIYAYNKIDTVNYGFVDAGQIGLASGNAQLASMVYNIGGLTTGNIQYYDASENPLFTLGYDYVLILDGTMEASFLNTGKLSTTDTFEWTGLKELLRDNPTQLANTGTVNTKEQILQNILKNAA